MPFRMIGPLQPQSQYEALTFFSSIPGGHGPRALMSPTRGSP
eukprot:CAMPEP_0206320020 /NCGR_PEP_ID=MMETSP0106_2-20121207/18090_1 /ASSEMBLY_ACC=CAM_ASM_000206 /TAXON_ID=81532 /ORGANISM="Acanthoeca-like sp., Strain 10tr" /LENGTH=41 /DNA_ID= /DNA_START= /DNA_END= /DNA_ORIENTATION=